MYRFEFIPDELEDHEYYSHVLIEKIGNDHDIWKLSELFEQFLLALTFSPELIKDVLTVEE